jgi:membrane fusion protein, multidrug efflux system
MQDLATSTYVSEAAPSFSPSVHPDLPAPAAAHAPRRRWWPWILVLFLAGIGAYVLFSRATLGQAKTPAPVSEGGGGGGARGVPVVAATARSGSMGVYLAGLGTVTPLNTVTIHSRVDGELVDVMFKEGQMVHQGDLLARIDPRPFEVQLTQANGQKAKDEAALKNGQLDLTRYQDLIQRGIIPRQQVDTQVATVTQAEGAVQSDQGQIDSAKLNLVYSRIIAPISGRVGLRLIDPGNIVHASDAGGLVVITQIDPIAVIYTLPQDDLARVQRAMKDGKVTVDAFGRDGIQKLGSGELLLVDNQVNAQTATIRLKAVLPNPDHALWPNAFVKARMRLTTLNGALVVPASVVQRGPTGTFAYVVGADKTASVRPVEVTSIEGDVAVIGKGLQEGDVVVTDGQNQLRPGSRIAARPPANGGAGPSASASAKPQDRP